MDYNFVYETTSMYDIYSRVMTEVNATVGEMSATVGGNVRNSGEIEHDLGHSRLEVTIHNFA